MKTVEEAAMALIVSGRVCCRHDGVCAEGRARDADPQHHSRRLHQQRRPARGRGPDSGHQTENRRET